MWYVCKECRVVFAEVNGFGDPAPSACPCCNRPLVKTDRRLKVKKFADETTMKVEFGDDITEAEKIQVLQTLQQSEDVKVTDRKDLK